MKQLALIWRDLDRGQACLRAGAQGCLQRSVRGQEKVVEVVVDCSPPFLSHCAHSSFSGRRSTFTSRKVTTRTEGTKRAGRYMSHTHASCIKTSTQAGVVSLRTTTD